MRDALMEAYKGTNFTSSKWKSERLRAQENDFVMICRGRRKISPLGKIEYGRVKKVSEDGRTLEVIVCRSNKELNAKEFPVVKEIVVDSRNCFLIFRDDR